MIVRVVSRTKEATSYHLGLIERLENEYGIALPKVTPANTTLKVIYVKSPSEFPPAVIGWMIGEEPFDYETLLALAKDFGEKMKTLTPKVAYIMRDVCYFETKGRENG